MVLLMETSTHCSCCHRDGVKLVSKIEYRGDYQVCKECVDHIADYEADLPEEIVGKCPQVKTYMECEVCP
jgi:hypothetical protein